MVTSVVTPEVEGEAAEGVLGQLHVTGNRSDNRRPLIGEDVDALVLASA